MLREDGFSLPGNTKTLEGKQHPDRDGQFTYLNEQARTHRDAGQPVISVDHAWVVQQAGTLVMDLGKGAGRYRS